MPQLDQFLLSLCSRSLKCVHNRKINKFFGVIRCCDTKQGYHDTQSGRSTTGVPLDHHNEECEGPEGETTIGSGDVVWNPCNVQMIPDQLYKQIFIDCFRQTHFPVKVVEKCQNHLQEHSLWGQDVKHITPTSLKLPELQGEDINDHFRNIALQQTFRYRKLLSDLVASEIPVKPSQWKFKMGWTKYEADGTGVSVPFPEEDGMVFDVEVCMSAGQVPTLACALTPKAWYSWCSNTLIHESNEGTRTAGGSNCSVTLNDLIPLETHTGELSFPLEHQREKIVIGHNVSYDRARIKEQYFLKGSKLRFMDTMSMHIAISGITSYQRALKLTAKSGLKTLSSAQLHKMGMESSVLEWGDQSSLNNLADVYKLYCNEDLNKAARDVFVKGTLQDVRKDFQNLLFYCANDVVATKNIFNKLLPMFYERFPHPVTLAGTLEMGTTFLPINSNWSKYIQNSENAFIDYENEMKSILMKRADEALKLLEGEKYKADPWLWDLDWKVPKRRTKSKLGNESQKLPAWYRKLLYKESDPDYKPGPAKISTSMQIVPKLLRLTWFGFPLHYSRKGGWGFLVNQSAETLEEAEGELDSNIDMTSLGEGDSELIKEGTTLEFPYEEWIKIWEIAKEHLLHRSTKANQHTETVTDVAAAELRNKSEQSAEALEDFVRGLQTLSSKGLWAKGKKSNRKIIVIEGCSPHPRCAFVPLPHKDGPTNRVGNPLAKDFLSKIEEGVLTSAEDGLANKVVRLSKMTSYWKNNRDRILGQMVVQINQDESQGQGEDGNPEYGAILPQVAVSGTLTRRAVEPTWMTASNAYEDRIGSELKGMIQAPPSYYFVGADVDSQELWIASSIGDASFAGIHGSTALGWMTLQGKKSAGTDMHSKTANLIGIGRDQAKILNYARIYGAGSNFAERLLSQFNKQLTATDARSKAKTMYQMTKGKRKYVLNEMGRQLCNMFEDLRDKNHEPFSKAELLTLMRSQDEPVQHYMELVERVVWDGGTESHMFNRLEEIAQQECPKTPFLNCSISRSLVPAVVHSDFMTSRVNWVVQSSAVDYLHLMLTCMHWLTGKFDIDARFAISVHDEVRYIVQSEDRYRAALALQITNLLTRSACAYQLGMYDLPMSVAYFSCVDIDRVLRKEVTQDCVTPSNPNGLSNGYGIPLGQGLDIEELLQITGGTLQKST